MKAQWDRLQAKYSALSHREKLIVALAVVFGGGMLMFNFGIDPQLTAARTASRELVQARAELAPLRAQVEVLKKGLDPDAANRARLAQLKQQLAGNGERLAKFEAGMVSPAVMPNFLHGLLARNGNVELLSLKTLPAALIGVPSMASEKKADGTAATAPAKVEGIFQHGVELRLAGTYNDLLSYLADLEAMPQKVMWQSVSLTVEKYPRNVLTLRLFTLSLDQNWLVV